MAISVKNLRVRDLLNYLENKAKDDPEANRLHSGLLADQTEATYQELKAGGELPQSKTRGGAYII